MRYRPGRAHGGGIIGLTVKPVDGETEHYGKTIHDLQDNIEIASGSIKGTSKYVTGFTQFSDDPAEQEGTYIALEFETIEGMSVTTELIGGSHGPVAVEDGFCIYRITNPAEQSIKVTISQGDSQETIVYSLESLVCETPEDAVLDSVQDPVRDNRYNPLRGEN